MYNLSVIYESKITLFMSKWKHLFNAAAWGLLFGMCVFVFLQGLMEFDEGDRVFTLRQNDPELTRHSAYAGVPRSLYSVQL